MVGKENSTTSEKFLDLKMLCFATSHRNFFYSERSHITPCVGFRYYSGCRLITFSSRHVIYTKCFLLFSSLSNLFEGREFLHVLFQCSYGQKSRTFEDKAPKLSKHSDQNHLILRQSGKRLFVPNKPLNP